MIFHSLTTKLMIFFIVISFIFGGLSNHINTRYLINQYDVQANARHKKILDAVEKEFTIELKEIESTINTFEILVTNRFLKNGQFTVPNMNDEEDYYESLFRDYLKNEHAKSTSLYLYFNPELDDNAHDVWIHAHDETYVREKEIPLSRYKARENMDWFYGPKKSKESNWIPPYYNRYDEHITSYVAPIYYKDTFIGIIGMYLELDEVKNRLRNMTYYPGDLFWVYNAQNQVIYNPEFSQGTNISNFITYSDNDENIVMMNAKEYYYYKSEVNTGWNFVYMIPKTILDSKKNQRIQYVVMIFMGALFISITLLWISLSRYRRLLRKTVKILDDNKNSQVIKTIDHNSKDEIGLLIDAINENQEKLKKSLNYKNDLAYNHWISGLPNRNKLIDDLSIILEERNLKAFFSIIYFDIDNFRSINDILGYDMGNDFIRMISERMKFFETDVISLYHTDIDEFVFLIKKDYLRKDIINIVNDVLKGFGKNIKFKDNYFFVTICAGIVLKNPELSKLNDIFRAADIALFEAKKEGRNNYAFYNKKMFQELLNVIALENNFSKALKAKAFVLHYQPKFNIKNNEYNKVEALVRWDHPKKGLVYPDNFIHFAEKSGLITELGKIVLEKVCLQLKQWEENKMPIKSIAINISLREMYENDFAENIINIIKNFDINPENIEIEITESMFEKNPKKLIQKLMTLKNYGLKIALDDYGAGYSSLKIINELPIDILKIDKSLIRKCHTSERTTILIRSIVHMAKELGLEVIAEGVENEAERDIVTNLGCDSIQGYYYAKPMNPEQLEQFIKEFY